MNKKILFIFTLFLLIFSFSFDNVYADDNLNEDYLITKEYKYCGSDDVKYSIVSNIPSIIPSITSTVYNSVMVITPLILVIMGSIDLIKAMTSNNEDEINKGKTNFIKRTITGLIIFVIVLIVKFLVSMLSDTFTNGWKVVKCIDCFINNECGTTSTRYNANSNSKTNAPKSNQGISGYSNNTSKTNGPASNQGISSN